MALPLHSVLNSCNILVKYKKQRIKAVCGTVDTDAITDLQVLLQAAQHLAVHMASLSDSQALLLGLTQTVLEDAAVLVGAVQFPPQLLQLVDLLLQVAVSHLLHLCPQLVHFILEDTQQRRGPGFNICLSVYVLQPSYRCNALQHKMYNSSFLRVK